MRLSLFSNYLNEHMLPLCNELASMPGVDFTFVALNEYGGNSGRRNLNASESFVLRAFEDELADKEAMRHAIEDDVVVFGHLDGREWYVSARMERDLLTFRAAERLLKRGLAFRFVPQKARRTHDWFVQYSKKQFFVLCNSAYTAYDLNLSGFPLDKCLAWGYYPEVPSVCDRGYAGGDCLDLLWVGRLVDFKKPLVIPRVLSALNKRGVDAHVTVAGSGQLSDKLDREAKRLGVCDLITRLGEVSSDEIDKLMRTHDALLFTSGRGEGWGAPVSEAMARGCPVVANASAGSPPFLIRHDENGLLYRDGDVAGLVDCVSLLAQDAGTRERLGREARRTMTNTWNARVAARNLIEVSEALLKGERRFAHDGPCSPAPLYKDNWFKRRALS